MSVRWRTSFMSFPPVHIGDTRVWGKQLEVAVVAAMMSNPPREEMMDADDLVLAIIAVQACGRHSIRRTLLAERIEYRPTSV